jgi:predicted phage tail protein
MIDSFFDKNLFQQVVSGLIVLLVSVFLGNKEVGKITVSKFWKLIIILAWVSFWGGLYLIFNNLSNGGIYNVYVSMGISLAVFGIFLNLVGKFFIWWQH